jgi:hypothetical protein
MLPPENIFTGILINFCSSHSFFLNSCALATPVALKIKFCPTYPAILINFNRINIWRIKGKGSFYAYTIRDFSNSKTCCMAGALPFNNITPETLDTFLTAFNNFIIHRYIITRLEIWKFFLAR